MRLIFVSQQKRFIPLDVRYDLMSAFVKKRRGFPVLPESGGRSVITEGFYVSFQGFRPGHIASGQNSSLSF